MPVGGLDGHAPAERVAHEEHLLLDPDGVEETVDPVGVAAEREFAAREIGRPAETRQRRSVDVASLGDESVDRTAVASRTERPYSQEDDRQPAAAGHAGERRP